MISRLSLTSRWLLVPALSLLYSLALSAPAHAYLDPGTGAMLISAIVGLFATIGLAIKTYWYKLVRLFRRTPPEEGTPSELKDQQAQEKQQGPDKDV